jgi:hypothetical protein
MPPNAAILSKVVTVSLESVEGERFKAAFGPSDGAGRFA